MFAKCMLDSKTIGGANGRHIKTRVLSSRRFFRSRRFGSLLQGGEVLAPTMRYAVNPSALRGASSRRRESALSQCRSRAGPCGAVAADAPALFQIVVHQQVHEQAAHVDEKGWGERTSKRGAVLQPPKGQQTFHRELQEENRSG